MTVVRIRVVLGAAGLVAAATLSAPSAFARTSFEPCGPNSAPHVTSVGVHCGGIFEIPAGATRDVPRRDAPPKCNAANRMITAVAVPASAGVQSVFAIGGTWNYWTQGGDVQSDGNSTVTNGARRQPIDVNPSMHNWASKRSKVRVFFRCTTIP